MGTLEHVVRGKVFSESFPPFQALETFLRNLELVARVSSPPRHPDRGSFNSPTNDGKTAAYRQVAAPVPRAIAPK